MLASYFSHLYAATQRGTFDVYPSCSRWAKVVDLHDQPIDLHIQRVEGLHHRVTLLDGRIDPRAGLDLRSGWDADLVQPGGEVLQVILKRFVLDEPAAVSIEPHLAGLTQLWVEEFEGSSCRVARIRKRLLATSLLSRDEMGEVGVGDIGLTPDLNDRRWIVGHQPQRDSAHDAGVVRDVIPAATIAARQGLRQVAVLIDQSQGDTVDLVLDGVFIASSPLSFRSRSSKSRSSGSV